MSSRIDLDLSGLLAAGEKLSDASAEMRATIMALPQVRSKFESMMQRGGHNECWPWLRGKNTSGYGIFCIARGRIVSSRAAWEIFCGPIPEGAQILHKCDNPSCVNPGHIFLGTVQDNVSDMWAKGRAVIMRGADNPASKLTLDDIRAIRMSELSLAELSINYGVSRTSISAARRGLTWLHVTDAAPVPTSLDRFWRADEVEKLRSMAGNCQASEIAFELGRTTGAIYCCAHKNGIMLRIKAAAAA